MTSNSQSPFWLSIGFCGGKLSFCASMGGNKKRPAGRPKNTVSEQLDITRLHLEWDACEEIRKSVLEGGGLIVEGKGEDIKAVLDNQMCLQPFITRMSLTQSRPMPSVDHLRLEVEALYLKNKRGQTPEDQPDVIAIAWRIRKLLTYLKWRSEDMKYLQCLVLFLISRN